MFKLLLMVGLLPQPLIVAQEQTVTIGDGSYRIQLVSDLREPMFNGVQMVLRPVEASMRCPNGDIPGSIRLSAALTRLQQAKGIVHEVVHVAWKCDKRDMAVDEKVATDIADVFNSGEGPFLVRELGRR